MSKFFAALISVSILASTFASSAEAFPGRRLGFFLGGMAAMSMMSHAAEERRREEAYQRMRARQIAAARERAAAAKRERARQLAMQQRKAAQIAAAEAAQQSTPPADAPALKKSDRLPSADDASAVSDAPPATTTIEKTPVAKAVTTTAEAANADAGSGCRKYSAATDSLVDTPCQ